MKIIPQLFKTSTVKFLSFLNVTNLPIVGIVVTISPNLSLYNIVVFPAASNPTINILISFLPNRLLNKFAKAFPILAVESEDYPGRKMEDI